MDIIELVGGVTQAQEIIESPLCIRASHFNLKDKSYVARLRYIQTKPWRLIVTTEPEDMVTIDEPNQADLVSLDDLSKALIELSFTQISNECVIYNTLRKCLVSEAKGKGLAVYYTGNIKEALRTTASEALSIIVNMRCSDEEREGMQILVAQSTTNEEASHGS